MRELKTYEFQWVVETAFGSVYESNIQKFESEFPTFEEFAADCMNRLADTIRDGGLFEIYRTKKQISSINTAHIVRVHLHYKG